MATLVTLVVAVFAVGGPPHAARHGPLRGVTVRVVLDEGLSQRAPGNTGPANVGILPRPPERTTVTGRRGRAVLRVRPGRYDLTLEQRFPGSQPIVCAPPREIRVRRRPLEIHASCSIY